MCDFRIGDIVSIKGVVRSISTCAIGDTADAVEVEIGVRFGNGHWVDLPPDEVTKDA